MLAVELFALLKETCKFSPQNVCFSVAGMQCDQAYFILDVQVCLNQFKVMPVSDNILQDVNS